MRPVGPHCCRANKRRPSVGPLPTSVATARPNSAVSGYQKNLSVLNILPAIARSRTRLSRSSRRCLLYTRVSRPQLGQFDQLIILYQPLLISTHFLSLLAWPELVFLVFCCLSFVTYYPVLSIICIIFFQTFRNHSKQFFSVNSFFNRPARKHFGDPAN